MRRRVRAAIISMERQKSVGLVNVHSEILMVAPRMSDRILTNLWDKEGETLLVHKLWTSRLLVPVYKKGINWTR